MNEYSTESMRVIELGNFEVDRSEARDREILINLSLLGTPLLIMDGTYIWVNGASWFDASTPTEIGHVVRIEGKNAGYFRKSFA